MIPKIMHQIWLGGKPLPKREAEFRQGWIAAHKDWKHILWNEDRIEKHLDIKNKKEYNLCKSFSEQSDILRFEILSEYGGVYLDTDMECKKSLNPLLGRGDFLVCEQRKRGLICGAFLAATKNHDIINNLVKSIPERYITHGKENANGKYGPCYLSLSIKKYLRTVKSQRLYDKVKIFPPEYFYPRPHEGVEETINTFGKHHWAGSWL